MCRPKLIRRLFRRTLHQSFLRTIRQIRQNCQNHRWTIRQSSR